MTRLTGAPVGAVTGHTRSVYEQLHAARDNAVRAIEAFSRGDREALLTAIAEGRDAYFAADALLCPVKLEPADGDDADRELMRRSVCA